MVSRMYLKLEDLKPGTYFKREYKDEVSPCTYYYLVMTHTYCLCVSPTSRYWRADEYIKLTNFFGDPLNVPVQSAVVLRIKQTPTNLCFSND